MDFKNEISKLITVREWNNSIEYETLFVDFYYDNVIEPVDYNSQITRNTDENVYPAVIMPQLYSGKGILTLKYEDYDSEEKILKLIEANFDKILENKKDKFLNNEIIAKDYTVRHLISRLNSMGSYIAVEGRIGPGRILILNKTYYNAIKDIQGYFEYVIDDNLDNKIYVYRKNNFDQPGTIIIYNDEEKMFDLVNLGFFPEKQVECLYIN